MVWTSYAGIEVIECQEALVRHPRWGAERPVPLKGGSLLLLADEILLVVCDDCNFNGITGIEPYVKPVGEQKPIMKQAEAVSGHRSSTHLRTTEQAPLYPEEVIKAAIKVWLKWKNTRLKNWSTAAADEFNKAGFKPLRSAKWTSSSMGSLVNHYVDRPKYKNIKPSRLSEVETQALVGATAVLVGPSGSVERHQYVVERPVEVQETSKTEEIVTVVDDGGVKPTLNFAGSGLADQSKSFVLSMNTQNDSVVSSSKSEPIKEPTAPSKIFAPRDSDFEYVADLPDGTFLFKYKGVLMVGNIVKGVQV